MFRAEQAWQKIVEASVAEYSRRHGALALAGGGAPPEQYARRHQPPYYREGASVMVQQERDGSLLLGRQPKKDTAVAATPVPPPASLALRDGAGRQLATVTTVHYTVVVAPSLQAVVPPGVPSRSYSLHFSAGSYYDSDAGVGWRLFVAPPPVSTGSPISLLLRLFMGI